MSLALEALARSANCLTIVGADERVLSLGRSPFESLACASLLFRTCGRIARSRTGALGSGLSPARYSFPLAITKGSKVRSRFDRILAFAVVGGIIGASIAVLMFGHSNVQGNDTRTVLGLMIPLFCMIGAVVGAASAALLDRFRT